MLSDKDLLKFRSPLHVKYISEHLMKLPLEDAKQALKIYLGKGILEVKNDYYVLKSKNA
jgi:hypothetical protein